MYTLDELQNKKYSELQKIAKSLKISARQKGEKLIQQIVKYQDASENTETNDTVDVSQISSNENEEVSSQTKADSVKEKEDTRSSDDTNCAQRSRHSLRKRSMTFTVFNNAQEDVPKSGRKPRKSKRSNTFVISSENIPKEERKSKRSNTFVISSENLNKKRPFDNIESPFSHNKKRKSSVISSDNKCKSLNPSQTLTGKQKTFINESIPTSNSSVVAKKLLSRKSLKDISSKLSGNMSYKPSPYSSSKFNRSNMSPIITPKPKVSQLSRNSFINSPNSIRKSVAKVNSKHVSILNKKNLQQYSQEGENLLKKNSSAIGTAKTSSSIPRFVAFASKLNIPDFSRIHEKQFDKMETLDEYLKRKEERAKNVSSVKVKKSFKPNITSTDKLKLNFAGKPKVIVKKSFGDSTGPVSRRMAFKPNTTIDSSAQHNASKAPRDHKNMVKKGSRATSSVDFKNSQRNFLKGVRLNKRFQLQMEKRGIRL